MKLLPQSRTVGSLPLALSACDIEKLRRFLENCRGAENESVVLPRQSAPRPEGSIELDPRAVRLSAENLSLPGHQLLCFAPGNRLKGFNPVLDRLFVVFGVGGCSLEVWYKRRHKGTRRTERGVKLPRIHSDAALFVTSNNGPRVWNGGLPSLGKRR